MGQYKGSVRWFNNAEGYEFLTQDDGADVSLHHSSLQTGGGKRLDEDARVDADIVDDPKDPQADQEHSPK